LRGVHDTQISRRIAGHTGASSLSNLVGEIAPPEKAVQMRSDTQGVRIAAAPEEVWAFVADGANLPRWAIGFAKSVRPDRSGWTV